MFEQFEYLHTIGSTNDYLRNFVEEGVPRIVVAGEQTAGRGRYGRRWLSPRGQGLYVSYLFFPGWEADNARFLSIIPALAVAATVVRLGGAALPLKLKLPNDILVGERKLSGILTELGSLEKRITWAILGVGINLYQTTFPEELAGLATSLYLENIRVDHPLDCCDLLTEELGKRLRQIGQGGASMVEAEYHSMSLIPKPAPGDRKSYKNEHL